MCNPRRVRVRATRELAVAWEQEVRRQVTRRGRATGQARVREGLSATVGAPTLTALTMVLARVEGWERDGETFRHALDGGYVAYYPATRELEIVAEVSDEVEGSGVASTVVRGQIDQRLEAEGEGHYYDDYWGGVTEAGARAAAGRAADVVLDAQAEALRRRAREQADETEGAAVEAEAAARAELALAETAAARSEVLRRRAEARLAAVGVQGRNLFHQALAGAYREAILAYARARRAESVVCREDGGVLDIEFEIQL